MFLKHVLYTWGANSYGQLGQGNAEDLRSPQKVTCFPARGLWGGGGHSVLITEDEQLLVCGNNERGQLGLGHTSEVRTFQLCLSLGQTQVKQVSCGWDFTLILTDSGRLLGCGSNAYGQLGIQRVSTHTSQPLHIEALQDSVISVAAGLRHSLAVTSPGAVYQWGLGLSSQAKRALNLQPVPAHLTSNEPCSVPGLECVRLSEATAGSHHCVCLSEGGDVFLWGSNKHGQLGGPGGFSAKPRPLHKHLLGGERVRQVCSGWTHMLAQTESGRVFSWGRSHNGQLGRAGSNEPAEVEKLAGATQVACGSEHNLALIGGRIVSWGWNEHGSCGDGGSRDVTQPKLVPALSKHTTLLVGCGAGHCMAMCVDTEQM